jgi:hypothetical protein
VRDHSQSLLLAAVMATIMAIEITTTAIGVPTITALAAIVLAAIALNAAWIILLEIIAAGKQGAIRSTINEIVF